MYESLLSPDAGIARCLLDAQRQVHRLEEIVHQLAAEGIRDNLASAPAVALFQEGNRRLQRELDEFALDSLALVAIARSLGRSPHGHTIRREIRPVT